MTLQSGECMFLLNKKHQNHNKLEMTWRCWRDLSSIWPEGDKGKKWEHNPLLSGKMTESRTRHFFPFFEQQSWFSHKRSVPLLIEPLPDTHLFT